MEKVIDRHIRDETLNVYELVRYTILAIQNYVNKTVNSLNNKKVTIEHFLLLDELLCRLSTNWFEVQYVLRTNSKERCRKDYKMF